MPSVKQCVSCHKRFVYGGLRGYNNYGRTNDQCPRCGVFGGIFAPRVVPFEETSEEIRESLLRHAASCYPDDKEKYKVTEKEDHGSSIWQLGSSPEHILYTVAYAGYDGRLILDRGGTSSRGEYAELTNYSFDYARPEDEERYSLANSLTFTGLLVEVRSRGRDGGLFCYEIGEGERRASSHGGASDRVPRGMGGQSPFG